MVVKVAENPTVGDGDLKHLRLISLLVECSKECLLKLLYGHLKTLKLSFQQFVSKSTDRLQELKNERGFTEDEVNMLNPSPGDDTPVNLDKLDVRLICLLVKHLIPDPNRAPNSASLQGNLAVPNDDDFSNFAECRRIQICKNQIMYQRTRVVDDEEFYQIFCEIQDTCIRLLKKAQSSKEDISAMRKKMDALKISTIEVLQGNILQNVMQCVRWSEGDMDGIQTKLARAQMKMASSEKYDEVDASRLNNSSHLQVIQDEVSCLATEVRALTIEEGSKHEAAQSTEDQSFVQQLETSRQQLAAAWEITQENALNLLSRASIGKDYSLESNTEGCVVGQQQSPNQQNVPMVDHSSTIEEKELLDLCNKIDPHELHKLRINLGFEKAQMTRLEESYRDVNERIYEMLKAWHDAVVSCEQNPRHLLAVALEGSGNRLLAITLVSGKELDRIVKIVQAHENTKSCIKKIPFSKSQVNQGQPVIINHGAPGAINVFGGEFAIGGTMTIGTDRNDWWFPSDTSPGSNIALGPNIAMWSQPSPVGSAKGDSTDSVTHRPGNFKKEFDDSLTQTMMEIYLQKMKSVGAIMCSNSVCGTGFRVGTKYIATARHVISPILDPRRSGKQDLLNLQQACIVFSAFPNEPLATKYLFNAEFYYYDQELDVAILEISNTDGMMPTGLTLRKELFCRADTDIVSLIGYGHPNPKNQGKYFEYRCPVVERDSQAICAAQAFARQNQTLFKNGLLKNYPFSVVDEGYQGYDAPYRMLLHCFMEHGASGSPILACVNPSAGIVEVVGVLIRGLPEFFFCLEQDFRKLFPSNCRFEAGSTMSSFYTNMTSQRPDLADLATDLFIIPAEIMEVIE